MAANTSIKQKWHSYFNFIVKQYSLNIKGYDFLNPKLFSWLN